MIMSGAQIEGLRARKKRIAREAIAATARRLFAERGFDAVTVAEIAAAADVSEKTVFNHFPTKEDLAFAGREEGILQFVTAIAERPPGSSVLDVFRAMTHTVLDVFVAGGDEDLLAVAKIIRGSRALQERLTVGGESGAAAITAAVAEPAGWRITARPKPVLDSGRASVCTECSCVGRFSSRARSSCSASSPHPRTRP